jgi:hypothetical protein
MSISGLYDSEIGDRLARASLATLAPYKRLARAEIDDEAPRIGGCTARLCACGGKLARPYKVRKKVYVCERCAAATPRQPRSRITSNKCGHCKKILPRTRLVMRRGVLYCKTCAVNF